MDNNQDTNVKMEHNTDPFTRDNTTPLSPRHTNPLSHRHNSPQENQNINSSNPSSFTHVSSHPYQPQKGTNLSHYYSSKNVHLRSPFPSQVTQDNLTSASHELLNNHDKDIEKTLRRPTLDSNNSRSFLSTPKGHGTPELSPKIIRTEG